MGPSVYQCDCRTYRKWKIRLCQEIRTQYPTYDDPNTGSHLVVLWRIPDFMRTVDGANFQQGLPSIIEKKHLIILDDLMDETDQRVASLFTKRVTTETSASCTSFRICFIEENTIEP